MREDIKSIAGKFLLDDNHHWDLIKLTKKQWKKIDDKMKLELQLEQDQLIFGHCIYKELPDGTKERIDPRDIIINKK